MVFHRLFEKTNVVQIFTKFFVSVFSQSIINISDLYFKTTYAAHYFCCVIHLSKTIIPLFQDQPSTKVKKYVMYVCKSACRSLNFCSHRQHDPTIHPNQSNSVLLFFQVLHFDNLKKLKSQK